MRLAATLANDTAPAAKQTRSRQKNIIPAVSCRNFSAAAGSSSTRLKGTQKKSRIMVLINHSFPGMRPLNENQSESGKGLRETPDAAGAPALAPLPPSAAASPAAVPHAGQNLLCSGSSLPHSVQYIFSPVPESRP